MSDRRITRLATVCGGLLVTMLGCAGSGSRADRPGAGAESDRANSTGSISTVSGDRPAQRSVARVEEMLEGHASGVRVVRLPNGDLTLRIRGVSSPGGAREPLVVIDGMPVPERGIGQALAGLNPQDVKRIEVLKDAGSTAAYGRRGANGVIVITTRRSP